MFERLEWRSSSLFGEGKKNIGSGVCGVPWQVCSAACDTVPATQKSDTEQDILVTVPVRTETDSSEG